MKRRVKAPRTLVVGIGNTTLFCGVFSGARRERTFRLLNSDLAQLAVRADARIDRAAVCSVVPKQTSKITGLIERQWKVKARVLTANSPHGLTLNYRQPRELGTDRLAAAMGAYDAFPGENIIVVDCGTATTITALRSDGTLLGGAILPGLGLWPEMLATRTAQLPRVPVARPRVALGRSTREGIASGVFFGHCGAVREVVSRVRTEAFGRAPVRVVGTGGYAPLFSRENLFGALQPDLVLRGLLVLAG